MCPETNKGSGSMNNLFLEKLRAGQKPVGIFSDTASPFVVECLGRAGFDYVIIDNEHSPVEAETSAEMIRAAELTGLTPFVRVREISRPAVLKLLDVGAQGLIVPNVNSPDEVRALVSYAKYAPVGNRGFCPSRKDGWGYGLELDVAETMAHFNRQVLLIPQCETIGALEHIEEIAETEGVDGIFVGPFDLSIAMGIPGRFDTPDFQAALARILRACHAAGKFCLLFAMSTDKVREGFGQGFDSMTYNLDAGLMIECFRERLREIRGE